jgi:hypothetical protein
MKFLAVVLILAMIVAVVWLAVYVVKHGVGGLRVRKAKWRVIPRTGRDDEPQLWLCKPGEDDFFFWPTTDNQQWAWDRAQMEAEIQANEFNRMHKELNR